VAKFCEPPAGVALLSGALKQHGIECTVMDANLEGLLWLAQSGTHPCDSWTRRALAHYEQNLSDLKSPGVYQNMGRYRQRMMDINRVITSSLPERFRLTLADYTDSRLRPVKSEHLLIAAQTYEENPFYRFFEQRLADIIEGSESDHVGLSLCFLSQALTTFALAGWIKARFPQKKIIMGGGLITSWMSSPVWENPFEELIDILVKGEGEEALLTLEGIAQKDVEQPLPDFDFCKWDSYLAPGRILPFRASSGCYWSQCRFCPEKAEKSSYRQGKNRALTADLETLHEKYRPSYVHFLDNALSPSFLRALSGNVMPFAWYGFARFTHDLADPEFCRALYRSGCRMLNLGLESGDQDVLDRMNKGTDLDTASNALTSLKKAGITAYVYLLFGTSFENEASAEKTLEYVARHSDRIGFLNVAIFNLPRYSEDAGNLETDQFYEGDLSLYLNFRHPQGWGRNAVRRFLDKRFKRHPSIAPILRIDPPFFTSNHAMFVNNVLVK